MTRPLHGLRLVALVAFEGAAVVALHRLGTVTGAVGWSDLDLWLETVAPEDAVAAILRLAALGASYWLLGSTLIYLAASAARVPQLVGSISWATLPGIRRAVDGVVAASIAAPMFIGTAAPATAAEPGVAVQVQVPTGPSDDGARPPVLRRQSQGPTTHAVVRGDNLWSISQRRLGTGARVGEVARYWVRVIDVNDGRLRSGNPSLIYPGEVVELPEPPK